MRTKKEWRVEEVKIDNGKDIVDVVNKIKSDGFTIEHINLEQDRYRYIIIAYKDVSYQQKQVLA